MSWNSFFNSKLQEILDESGFEYRGYKVSYSSDVAKLLNTNNASRHKITPTADITTDIKIENTDGQDAFSSISLTNVPLIRLPILTDNGFMIRGTRYNCLNEISQADGWYLLNADEKKKHANPSLTLASGTVSNTLSDELKEEIKASLNEENPEGADASEPAVEKQESELKDLNESGAIQEEVAEEANDDSFEDDEAGKLMSEEIAATLAGTGMENSERLTKEAKAEALDAATVNTQIDNAVGIILYYRAPFGSNLSFYAKKNIKGEIEYYVQGRKTSNKVSWFTFFRAIYPELTLNDIYNMYKQFDIIQDAYSYESGRLGKNTSGKTKEIVTAYSSSEKCARETLSQLFGRNQNSKEYLKNMENPSEELFRRINSIKCDTSERNKNLFSFVRLAGLTLSRDFRGQLSVADKAKVEPYLKDLHVGSKLTNIQLAAIDKCQSLKEIWVKKGNKEFRVTKPQYDKQHSFMDEIKEMFMLYLLTTEGVGSTSQQDIFENKCVTPIEGKIEKSLRGILNDFQENFVNEVSRSSFQEGREITFNPVAEDDYDISFDTIDEDSSKSSAEADQNVTKFRVMEKLVPIFRVPIEDNYAKFLMKIQSSAYFQNKDDTNSMGVFGQEKQVKYALGSEVPDSLRYVREDQYGLLCPYSTSEGGNIGLNLYLTLGSEIENNVVKKRVYVLHNGQRVKDNNGKYKTCLLSAGDISRSIIASAGQAEHSSDDTCEKAYMGSEVVVLPWRLVEFEEMHQAQNVSPLLAVVPSFWHNGGKRGVMSVNTMKQVYPTIGGERSYVDAGVSQMYDVGVTRARTLMEHAIHTLGSSLSEFEIEDTDYIEIFTDAPIQKYQHTILSYRYPRLSSDQTFSWEIPALTPTIKFSLRHGKINIKDTNHYTPDDIVIYMNDVDITEHEVEGTSDLVPNDKMAEVGIGVGVNLRIAFLFGGGYNYEDAMIFSERVVGKGKFAIIRMFTITEEIEIVNPKKDLDHDTEYTSFGYPYGESINRPDYMGEDGLPKRGAFLRTGDTVIAKYKTSIKINHDAENKNDKQKISYTPSSIVITEGKKNKGYVVASEIEEYDKDGTKMARASVTLMAISNIQQGDKFTGAHGNKGVIARILPVDQMPFAQETGEVPDVILNPSGVLPRENIGQLLELVRNAIGQKKNKIQAQPPFSKTSIEDLLKEAEMNDLKEVTMVNGETGVPFDRKAFIGTMYFYRSEHDVQGKYNAEGGKGPVSTNMTVSRCQGGGQRCGEQSSWTFMASGVPEVLDTYLGVQGSDAALSDKLTHSHCNMPDLNLDKMDNRLNNLMKVHYMMCGIDFMDYDCGKFRVLNDNIIENEFDSIRAKDGQSYYEIDNPLYYGNTGHHGMKDAMIERTLHYGKFISLIYKVMFPEVLQADLTLSLLWYIKPSKLNDKISVYTSTLVDALKAVADGEIKNYNDFRMQLQAGFNSKELKALSGKSNGSLNEILTGKKFVLWLDGYNIPILITKEERNYIFENDEKNHKPGTSSVYNYCRVHGASIGERYVGVASMFLGRQFLEKVLSDKTEDGIKCGSNPNIIDFNDTSSSRSLALALLCNQLRGNEKQAESKTTLVAQDRDTNTGMIVEFIQQLNPNNEKFNKFIAELANMSQSDLEEHITKMVYGETNYSYLKEECPVTYLDYYRQNSSSYLFIPPISYRKNDSSRSDSDLEKALSNTAQFVSKNVQIKMWSHTDTIYQNLEKLRVLCITALKNHSTKNAVLRDNTMSVRIRWSGRGYIVVDPSLKMDQIGLPITLAAGILNSHLTDTGAYPAASVLGRLFRGNKTVSADGTLTNSINEKLCSKIITWVSAGNEEALRVGIFKDSTDYITTLENMGITLEDIKLKEAPRNPKSFEIVTALFRECLEDLKTRINELLADNVVIMERAPSIWEYSASAYYAKLKDSDEGVGNETNKWAISISPLSCKLHNADFDGDQVSISLPITAEAQKAAKEHMLPSVRPISIKDGKPVAELNQDMILGLYWATIQDKNQQVTLLEKYEKLPLGCYTSIDTIRYHLRNNIVKMHDYVSYTHTFANGEKRRYIDTVGRLIFNSIIPDEKGFTCYMPFKVPKEDGSFNFEMLPVFKTKQEIQKAEANKEKVASGKVVVLTSNETEDSYELFNSAQAMVSLGEVEPYRPVYETYTNCPDFLNGNGILTAVSKDTIDNVTGMVQALGKRQLSNYLNDMKDFAFFAAQESGVSISLFDFRELLNIDAIKSEVDRVHSRIEDMYQLYEIGIKTKDEYINAMSASLNEAQKNIVDQITEKLDPYNDLYLLIASGARGKFSSLMNFAVMLGMSEDTNGQVIPRPSFDNYCGGLDARAFHDTSYHIRKALITSAINTGLIGETTRLLVYTLDHDRLDEKNCDTEAQLVELKYTAKLPKDFNLKDWDFETSGSVDPSWVAVVNEFNKIVDSTLEYASKPFRTVSTLEKVISKHLCKRAVMKDKNGNIKIFPVKFSLTKEFKDLLSLRAVDIESLRFLYGETELIQELTPVSVEQVDANIPAEENRYYVMNDYAIAELEREVLSHIPMYLAMYCKDTDGLCARCFGLNIDGSVPKRNEMDGVKTAQAMGQTVSQTALDSHKAGGSKTVSSFGKVRDMLAQHNIGESTQVIVAPTDGVIITKITDGCLTLGIANENGIQELCTFGTDTPNIMVSDEDLVHTGDLLYYTDTLNYVGMYRKLQAIPGYEDSALLKARLNMMLQMSTIIPGIQLRHFDILMRELLRFGQADETKILDDGSVIVKGVLYDISKLEDEGVPYTPCMVSAAKSQRLNKKYAASQAHAFLARQMGEDAILQHKSTKASPLCVQLRGISLTRQFGIGKASQSEEQIYNTNKHRKMGDSSRKSDRYSRNGDRTPRKRPVVQDTIKDPKLNRLIDIGLNNWFAKYSPQEVIEVEGISPAQTELESRTVDVATEHIDLFSSFGVASEDNAESKEEVKDLSEPEVVETTINTSAIDAFLNQNFGSEVKAEIELRDTKKSDEADSSKETEGKDPNSVNLGTGNIKIF